MTGPSSGMTMRNPVGTPIKVTITSKKPSKIVNPEKNVKEVQALKAKVTKIEGEIVKSRQNQETARQNQAIARQKQAEADQKIGGVITGIIQYLEKTKAMPKVQSSNEFLPLVDKAIADVKAIKQRHESGQDVQADMKAIQPGIMALGNKIAKA